MKKLTTFDLNEKDFEPTIVHGQSLYINTKCITALILGYMEKEQRNIGMNIKKEEKKIVIFTKIILDNGRCIYVIGNVEKVYNSLFY